MAEEEEAYNITAYCLGQNSTSEQAICAVYDSVNELADVVDEQAVGLNAFFLIFAVRSKYFSFLLFSIYPLFFLFMQ